LKNKILIIDDEPNIRWALSELFNVSNSDVLTADDSDNIFDIIIKEAPDLIFLDLKLKKIDGMDILRRINKEKIITTVIVITAYGSIETAVEALKLGAYDYITKPFDTTRVKIIAQKALEKTGLSKQVIHLRSQLEERYSLEGIIGDHSPCYSFQEFSKERAFRNCQLRCFTQISDRKRIIWV